VILAGDVGGTKTALALFDVRRRALAVVREGVLPSQGYAGLGDAIRQFLLEGAPASVDAACVGVAGPVIDGRCTATNLPWVVDEASLAACVSTTRVKLVNDLEAAAHGALGLKPSSLAALQVGEPRRATMALIAAGTGLGEVLLPWDGRRHRVTGSEGGHTDFAPRTELETELLRFLRKEFGRVSYERVVSGPELYNI
jgi:glucokinase